MIEKINISSLTRLVVLSMLLSGASPFAGAQPTDCGGGEFFGGTIKVSQRSIVSWGSFCDGSIADASFCGGTSSKIPHELLLENTEGVDLTCTTTEGTLCITPVGCGSEIGTRTSPREVRLRGEVPGTELRIVIADSDSGSPICIETRAVTITCTGSFGDSPVVFASSFEEQDGRAFSDWASLQCPECQSTNGTLRRAESTFFPEQGFETDQRGEIRGFLDAPAGAGLELHLWWRDGDRWVHVAAGEPAPTAITSVAFWGLPGTYRWEVRAGNEGGSYRLRIDTGNPSTGGTEP